MVPRDTVSIRRGYHKPKRFVEEDGKRRGLILTQILMFSQVLNIPLADLHFRKVRLICATTA